MLQKLWLIHPEKGMCEAFRNRFAGLPHVEVFQAKLEDLPPHDCFVTAGNSFGLMTAGIDAAVVHLLGKSLMDRIQHRIMDEYFGEQPVGTAFIIPTNHSRIPFLCHAPTMRVPGSIEGSDKVYISTWAALLTIHQHNRTSTESPIEVAAFPAMGTGFGGMTYSEAARQMAAA
jgi:O-acetyl-ADP-ribose deacetylase (regulator of RNase III)